jgi:hypothetical protein
MVDSINGYPLDIICRLCGNSYTVLVDREDLLQWTSGAGFIQDLMPYLSAQDRELLISATCDFCWNALFEATIEEIE